MSDNEGYEDIRYYTRDSVVHEESSTSKRNNAPRYSSPRYDYSLETNFDGEITIRRLPSAPDYANETVSYRNERKPNESAKGQSTAKRHSIEIETIDDENTTTTIITPPTTTAHTNNVQSDEIQLQCLECIRSQQNNRQQQQQQQQQQEQQQQYATEYSEPSSPKKKSFCAPVYSSVICRMAILTVFFVILSFLCFINIYLFIFIFVSIVVVIFVNMGAQEAHDEQFEE